MNLSHYAAVPLLMLAERMVEKADARARHPHVLIALTLGETISTNLRKYPTS